MIRPFFSLTGKSQKEYLLLFLLCFAAIFQAGFIDLQTDQTFAADQKYYRAIADAAPGIDKTVLTPFGYRLLGPYLAGVLPFDMHLAFYILNAVSLLLLTVLLFRFIKKLIENEAIAVLMTAGFLFNRYFFQFLAFNPYQINDTISLTLLLLAFESVQKKRFFQLSLILAVTALSREIWVLVFPYSFVLAMRVKLPMKGWVRMLTAYLPALLIFLFLRWYFATDWTGQYQEQFGSGLERLLTIEGLTKRFFMAFIPAVFLPFLFWNRTVQFFRRYPEWGVFLVFSVGSGLFGNDHERLMLPVAPLFFALCGYGLVPYLNGQERRVGRIFGFLFYLGSFHHIWGIVTLPNRLVTLIASVVLSLITLLLGFYLKKKAALSGQPH